MTDNTKSDYLQLVNAASTPDGHDTDRARSASFLRSLHRSSDRSRRFGARLNRYTLHAFNPSRTLRGPWTR